MVASRRQRLALFPEHVVEQTIDTGRWACLKAGVYAVELERGATALVRKRPVAGEPRAVVLLTHGFAQNRHAWHVRGRSLHNYLADAGYDVFAIDLRGVGRSRALGARRPTGFHEYVEIDLLRALAVIEELTAQDKLFLVGHSMGGAISCSVAGLMPGRVRGVVSLAGLYGFGADSWRVQAVTSLARGLCRVPLPRHYVVPTNAVGELLRVSRLAFARRAGRLIPLQPWVPGSIEEPILDEYLQKSFEPTTLGVLERLARMASGELFCDAHGGSYFARFERSGVPLLVIAGSRDELVSVADVSRCYERSQAPDKARVVLSDDGSGPAMGHVDLVIGHRAPATTWPIIRGWLDRRS